MIQQPEDFYPHDLSFEEVISEVTALKEELKDKVVILGHHYQSDESIQFADFSGDSLQLAKVAAKMDKEFIIFCGVHFMAETADMLTTDDQKVILPELDAGCSMADMAARKDVEKAWDVIAAATDETVVPVTYINCKASLKAFVGKHGGSICTSSNAESIISWAFDKGEKLLFFPDQHLGRNTCHKLGVALDDMVLYSPMLENGGLTAEQIKNAKVILWDGNCCVHQEFTVDQIKKVKDENPETIVIVHPESCFEVTNMADLAGSTSYIIKEIEKAPAGSRFAVGTETKLVERINKNHPDKIVRNLSDAPALCVTMSMINPRSILAALRSIKAGTPINVISVDKDVTNDSMKALDTMLDIS